MEALKTRLLAHQTALDNLLNLIPAKHYLTQQSDVQQNNKYLKNKSTSLVDKKQHIKKAKTEKLDPDAQLSISELQIKPILENEAQEDGEPPLILQQMQHETVISLREKLHARIQTLRTNRRATPYKSEKVATPYTPSATPSKNGRSRQEILERRQLRKAALKKKKAALNSKNNLVKADTAASLKRKSPQDDPVPSPATPSAMDVKEDVSFGTIKFGNSSSAEDLTDGPAKKKKKKGPTDTLGKLNKLNAQKAKFETLQSKNPEKAAVILEKQKWSSLLTKASGEKIKDDSKLLEKTLKRQNKEKTKMATQWNERKEYVKKGVEIKQKKRNDNIQKRVDAKKKKNTDKKKNKK